ncbi:hypothetical protein [Candidatus Endomicrobiellum agilis]|uniref:hypothetical protein n=1 Tax=Candidatus Endomicrobiellum agilis TaxID=3238957 RepID=UPI00357C06EE|nr:hypothetical protein [Endomicrobium sp.]
MLPKDIQQYINNGIKLIGVFNGGAFIATGKEEIKQAYTNDTKEIEALIRFRVAFHLVLKANY